MSSILNKLNKIVKLDYLTVMSIKHSHNLVINEEKLIIESLKSNIQNKLSKYNPNMYKTKVQFEEISWLDSMAKKQSYN
jgi:hypothetical protein